MSDIYIPPGCTTLDKIVDDQIRIGIQGPPFSGKTFSALTFPNPIILSIDRKTNAHQHRTDAVIVPMYDPAFIQTICPKEGLQAPPRRKEALLRWLETEGLKIKPTQTLIVDGSTGIETAYHMWFRFHEDELATTKGGGKNEFIEWRMKGEFFEELHTAFKSLACDVVYICHEVVDRDSKGSLNGQIRPLLTGQAGDKLAGNFTDWFRAITLRKPSNQDERKRLIDWAKTDDRTVTEWCNSTPPEHQSFYLWQTQPDDLSKCGASSLVNFPRYILASYEQFQKYRKPKH